MNRTLEEMAKAVPEPDWPDLDQAGYEALPTDPPDGGGYFRSQGAFDGSARIGLYLAI